MNIDFINKYLEELGLKSRAKQSIFDSVVIDLDPSEDINFISNLILALILS